MWIPGIIIGCIVLLCVITFAMDYKSNQQRVQSELDSRSYLVNQTKKENEDRHAANLLASLNHKLDGFVRSLYATYPIHKGVQRLHKRYFKNDKRLSAEQCKILQGGRPGCRGKIVETRGNEQQTAYTLNKGEKLSFCIRKQFSLGHKHHDSDQPFYDENVLIYVAIHELAHVMSVSIGHNKEFYKNFAFLLKYAIEIGMYKPVNFVEHPVDYCGVRINEQILH